jgi:hypothetical protein
MIFGRCTSKVCFEGDVLTCIGGVSEGDTERRARAIGDKVEDERVPRPGLSKRNEKETSGGGGDERNGDVEGEGWPRRSECGSIDDEGIGSDEVGVSEVGRIVVPLDGRTGDETGARESGEQEDGSGAVIRGVRKLGIWLKGFNNILNNRRVNIFPVRR